MQLPGCCWVAAAAVTFALNHRRLEFGHLFVVLGFVGFACAAGHELAAAALVAAAFSTLNAQSWYRDNFRQSYSVAASELLFSRGGRAVTVLGFFALAYLATSGRLDGPDTRRVGFGFHPRLQAQMEGLQDALADSFDNRPFNFVMKQGDILIWLDQRPFVDTRVVLYHRPNEENLLKMHDSIRRALRRRRVNRELSGRKDIWEKSL